MVENINGNGRVVGCTECEPPRQFKNKAGLNGHLPDSRDVLPNGKQSQMYQDLTYRGNQVIYRQDDIIGHLKNGASVNGYGNGDSLANSNENGYGDEPIGVSSLSPADPATYSHQGCGAPLVRMQRHCGGCGQEIIWTGLP